MNGLIVQKEGRKYEEMKKEGRMGERTCGQKTQKEIVVGHLEQY